MTIILRKFNIKNINSSSLILIIGQNKSGKSFVTKDILYNNQSIKNGIIITSKRHDENIKYVPEIFIYENYNKNIIKKFIKIQNNINIHSFIILDDCFENNKIYNKYTHKLYSKKFDLNTLCIIEIKNIINVSQKLKKFIDYIFIVKTDLETDKLALYNYLSDFLGIEYKLFSKLIDDYTSNYNFIVIDIKSDGKYIEDKLYWCNVPLHAKFKINSENNDDNLVIERHENIDKILFDRNFDDLIVYNNTFIYKN